MDRMDVELVECPECEAGIAEPCKGKGTMGGYLQHTGRVAAATQAQAAVAQMEETGEEPD